MFSLCLTKGLVIYGIMHVVNKVLGSGLVPKGTSLLPKSMLTYLYATL